MEGVRWMHICLYQIGRFDAARVNEIWQKLQCVNRQNILYDLRQDGRQVATGTVFFLLFSGTVIWHRGRTLLIHAPNNAAMEQIENDLMLRHGERDPNFRSTSLEYEP
jgi:hypothetical protein